MRERQLFFVLEEFGRESQGGPKISRGGNPSLEESNPIALAHRIEGIERIEGLDLDLVLDLDILLISAIAGRDGSATIRTLPSMTGRVVACSTIHGWLG